MIFKLVILLLFVLFNFIQNFFTHRNTQRSFQILKKFPLILALFVFIFATFLCILTFQQISAFSYCFVVCLWIQSTVMVNLACSYCSAGVAVIFCFQQLFSLFQLFATFCAFSFKLLFCWVQLLVTCLIILTSSFCFGSFNF